MEKTSPGAIVVGTGFGVLTHLRALREAGFEVHALVGRNPERTRDRAEKANVPLGLTSLEEALALPGVDVVAIATPPHTHAEIAIAAARAGKHIVCEKPFARDTEEARRMLAAVEEAGVVHLLGTEYRFSTGQALATRALRGGMIGEPRLATFLITMPGLADAGAEVPAWWADASQGGGWLGALCSHLIDEIHDTCGDFEGVSVSITNLVDRGWTAEDSFSAHFRTRSGVTGVIQSTGAAHGPFLWIKRLSGTRGTLWAEGDEVRVADGNGERKLDVPKDLVNPAAVPPDSAFMASEYDMLHASGADLGPFSKIFGILRNRINGDPVPDEPRAATFTDGVRCQVVLDAMRRSAREGGAWVSVDYDG